MTVADLKVMGLDGIYAVISTTYPLPVTLVGASVSGGQTDEITNALVTIPVVHHEVHEGEMFTASYKSPEGADIADNANLDILIQTGAKFPHLVFSSACGGTSEVLFYEDTTVSDVGTALSEVCNKRQGGETATVTVTHTPTVSGAGTLLMNFLVPGGSGVGQGRTGSTVRANTEWVLAPNKIYLIRLTNRAGNAQPASHTLSWYEESDN